MKCTFTKSFIRQLRKLEVGLIIEALENIELAGKDLQHPQLKTHPLQGSLKGCYSFSVNYKYRIVFQHSKSDTIDLLAIGDHDVYR